MAARPSSSLAVTALLPLLLLAARVASVSAVDCPDGYTDIFSHCFMIKTDAPKNWTNAETYCETTGGHLAVLSDCDVLGDVVARINAQGLNEYDFWIGATDAANEGVWLWITGEPVRMGMPFWWQGQPDGDTLYNCIIMYKPYNYHLADHSCNVLRAFVCQTSALGVAEDKVLKPAR